MTVTERHFTKEYRNLCLVRFFITALSFFIAFGLGYLFVEKFGTSFLGPVTSSIIIIGVVGWQMVMHYFAIMALFAHIGSSLRRA